MRLFAGLTELGVRPLSLSLSLVLMFEEIFLEEVYPHRGPAPRSGFLPTFSPTSSWLRN